MEMMISQQDEHTTYIKQANLEFQNAMNEIYGNDEPDETHDVSFGEDIASSIGANISMDSSVEVVEIEKTETGLGFNIVGGVDNAHFPSDAGIFISQINPNSKSFGLVKTGDKILSINGAYLTNKTHDEAVSYFLKIQKGEVARMLIDREAYLKCLDVTQAPSTVDSYNPERADNFSYTIPQWQRRSVSRSTSRSESSPQDANLVHRRPSCMKTAQAIDRLRGKAGTPYGEDNEDMQSTTSYAPSMHSIIDDVPRTPKKVHSLLDPRNPSTFTEILYVTIGLGALTAAGFAAYRIFKK